jgi:hypothetical protein
VAFTDASLTRKFIVGRNATGVKQAKRENLPEVANLREVQLITSRHT